VILPLEDLPFGRPSGRYTRRMDVRAAKGRGGSAVDSQVVRTVTQNGTAITSREENPAEQHGQRCQSENFQGDRLRVRTGHKLETFHYIRAYHLRWRMKLIITKLKSLVFSLSALKIHFIFRSRVSPWGGRTAPGPRALEFSLRGARSKRSALAAGLFCSLARLHLGSTGRRFVGCCCNHTLHLDHRIRRALGQRDLPARSLGPQLTWFPLRLPLI